MLNIIFIHVVRYSCSPFFRFLTTLSRPSTQIYIVFFLLREPRSITRRENAEIPLTRNKRGRFNVRGKIYAKKRRRIESIRRERRLSTLRNETEHDERETAAHGERTTMVVPRKYETGCSSTVRIPIIFVLRRRKLNRERSLCFTQTKLQANKLIHWKFPRRMHTVQSLTIFE